MDGSQEHIANHIKKLDWDSDFFGFEVGTVKIESKKNKVNFDISRPTLFYLFSKNPLEKYMEYIPNYKGILCDVKVTYQKKLNSKEVIAPEIVETNQFTEELRDLAIESGQFSRFNRDQNITQEKFIDLYALWLKNSLNGTIADKVFVFILKNKISGFITVRIKQNESFVGLIAVGKDAQRMGIGKMLMTAAESWSLEEGLNVINVLTQKDNTNACKFYENLDYTAVKTEYVYHFWKRNG